MLPDVTVHKSNIFVNEGGGGKEKKVFVIGALENKLGLSFDKVVMDTFSIVVSIVKRTCSRVVGPFGSLYVSWSMLMIFPS